MQYNFPSPTLWACLSVFEGLRDSPELPWNEIERRYHVTLNNLGPYCASLYLYTEMQSRLSSIVSQVPAVDADGDYDMTSVSDSPLSEQDYVETILSEYSPYFVHPSEPWRLPVSVPLEWCSPKVRVLVQILQQHLSPSFQGIIFCEQRQVAVCLSKILPYIPELCGRVRCADLLGSGVGSERMSKDIGSGKQRDTVRMFREGEINLRKLCGTSHRNIY